MELNYLNWTACTGPDYVLVNGVNLSTGLRYVYITTAATNVDVLYLTFNIVFLLCNFILLLYGERIKSTFMRSVRNKIIKRTQ